MLDLDFGATFKTIILKTRLGPNDLSVHGEE